MCGKMSIFAENKKYFMFAIFQLEFKKTILDRMVHMLSRGYVIPVVQFIRDCMESQMTDISLIRHFVTEVSLKTVCFTLSLN